MDLLTLTAGDMALSLAPELGGAVVSWTRGADPIFRTPRTDALARAFVRGLASFPLVPYSNRIAGGLFRFAGVDHQLPASFGGNAIHGIGWERAWHVGHSDPAHATLTLHHLPDASWPFAFRAEQRFALDADALTCFLMIQSLHGGPAPAGLGMHPYFPRSPEATLRFTADGVWHNREDMIPDRRTAVPEEWDHTTPRRLGDVALDNCFVGWRGSARIAYPDRGFAISIAAEPIFRHLIVFTPPGQDFIAVEPVTNMNDGLNRIDDTPGHGICILQPGETLFGRMTFRVEDIGA
jgi:aldose 1-epimerase